MYALVFFKGLDSVLCGLKVGLRRLEILLKLSCVAFGFVDVLAVDPHNLVKLFVGDLGDKGLDLVSFHICSFQQRFDNGGRIPLL